MGSIFRSEQMSLVQLFLQPEAAYETISKLGEAGCVQFIDMNEGVTMQLRKFIGEVRRCEEMERKIRYITTELEKDGFKVVNMVDEFPDAPKPRDIIELEAHLEKTETEIMELAANNVNLQTNYLQMSEMIEVLEKTEEFFHEQESHNFDVNRHNVRADPEGNRGRLGFVAGVINRAREYAFERMLWRISHGNVLLRRCELSEPLKDPKTGEIVYKSIFVVFFQGEQLQARIKKVCTGFHATMYPCSSSHEERVEMVQGVRTRLEDLKNVISQTEDHRNCVLAAVLKQLPSWIVQVTKMKAIYHTLNFFNVDMTAKCLIGEGWVPKFELATVEQALSEGSSAVGSTVPSFINVLDTKKDPPTYFRTNKFTRGFQNLIDAYGIANYREVNPALYTCISFPFLFAVMFGDMGHGLILFLFGLWMVVDEKRLCKRRGGEIWRIFFAGRYIILLMGIFAVYTGFHYNDMFSKSLNVFGTHWRVQYNRTTVLTNPTLQMSPTTDTRGVYPMGVDPIWQSAANKIIFLNSFKMKLSIIFGVLHMVFGVSFSVENFVYFKRYSYIFLQYIPQVLFLLLLFGYMVFMMFYKWVKYSPTATYEPDTPGCAPAVLIMFINMVLFKDNTALKGCDANMFEAQATLQPILVIVALICIPWMLIGTPVYIRLMRSQRFKAFCAAVKKFFKTIFGYLNPMRFCKHSKSDNIDLSAGTIEVKSPATEFVVETIEVNNGEIIVTELGEAHESGGHGHEDEPMSEIWIHQAIHTVEYVLSTISHTASYLRLWALSLAHAELSEVLWTMVLSKSLQFNGYVGCIIVFLIFAVWVFFTIAIMVMMEGLSAFLHTLRLHWVEFMSKFFEGVGYAFQPFSFNAIILAEDEDA